ncbi:hypothetical protein A3A59_06300 [Candidatus Gottesmanbacteria bacterium RIFCSPLOWO2_01_FULL_42_10]|nr:MAG: hypothetical protein A3A59_06300 [Candidatus Gottesmanbacteria bacterium RIFCSPLOWO2_01_FULL_42_10]
MKRKYLTIFLISIVGIWLVWFLLKPAEPQNQATVKIGNTIYKVDIADTEVEREQGLSGRPSLARDSGMLFVFPEKRPYAFWMKDMQFPLDFIWIADNQIADMTASVPVPSGNNLPTYQPQVPVDLILEINAGEIKKQGFQIGQKVDIKLK